VHEGIEQSLTMLAPKLRDARARVERAYDRTLPPLEQYGTELNQVWTNLLDNAADALASVGGGALRIATARDGDDGIVVVVEDAGPGIPAELQSRIFEPFFTTKPAGKGTGLGLEIVQRIVARHGGGIGVESAPGRTRVRVRLALAPVPPPRPLPRSPCHERDAPPARCTHPRGGPRRDARHPRGVRECLAAGSRWVHLRLCLSCGHVGCCDQSPASTPRRTTTAPGTRSSAASSPARTGVVLRGRGGAGARGVSAA
jgi:anti-sigma regulatory factor (Ser/Thr protein kinase)